MGESSACKREHRWKEGRGSTWGDDGVDGDIVVLMMLVVVRGWRWLNPVMVMEMMVRCL